MIQLLQYARVEAATCHLPICTGSTAEESRKPLSGPFGLVIAAMAKEKSKKQKKEKRSKKERKEKKRRRDSSSDSSSSSGESDHEDKRHKSEKLVCSNPIQPNPQVFSRC